VKTFERSGGSPYLAEGSRERRSAGGCVLVNLAAVALIALMPWQAAAAQTTVAPTAAQTETAQPTDQTGGGDEASGSAPSGYVTNLPPVDFFGSVSLSEGYTTNAEGLGGASSDEITRGVLRLGLHYDMPRLVVDAAYSLTGDLYARNRQLDELYNRLNLASTTTIVPERLFLRLNAFATPLVLTRVGALSSDGRPISNFNMRDSYGYSASPEYVVRFGDYATSVLSATQGGVFFLTPSAANVGAPPTLSPAQNTLSTSVMEQLTSGTYFERLKWNIIGDYTELNQTTRTDRQVAGLANLTYALTRIFGLTATGGYSEYKSSIPLTKNLNGPIALGGVEITYGPTFKLVAQAGTQNNFPTYIGSLLWVITPVTSMNGRVTDRISTPQGDILSRLSGLTALPGGGFTDQSGDISQQGAYGQPPATTISPVGPGGLPLDNSIYRMREALLSLSHTDDRMHYGLELFGNIRDRLDNTVSSIAPRTSDYGIRANVSRNMRPDLTGYIGASYSFANEFGGHDRILSADAGLNYMLSQWMSVYLTQRYIHRELQGVTGVSNAPLSDELIMVGIRAHF
jgi:hypothetical protein